MKTLLVALITALTVSLLSTAAIAQPKGPPEGGPPGQLKGSKQGPPMHLITGGGIVQNDNSGLGPGLLAIGGFVAQTKETEDSDTGLPARGQIQAKIFDMADPTNTLSMLHGRVVCIAELDEDIWEVRFQVTRSAGVFPVKVDQYGSLFVQDNGKPGTGDKPDMADESFDKPDDPNCRSGLLFGLEPVIAGNFTVH